MGKTQKQVILEHLKEYGSIDRLTAATELYIFELSSRIGELEAMGYEIKKETIGGQLLSGRKWTGKRYSLAGA